jgi:hypothetical protein
MSWLLAGVAVLLVTVFTSPALAQNIAKAEVSSGYNWLTIKEADDEHWEPLPKGWYVDVVGNLYDTLGIVGLVTGNYKTLDDPDGDFDLKLHTFMAGLRWSPLWRVRVFGQFLAGGVSVNDSPGSLTESKTQFVAQFGGGVNVTGSGKVGLRVGLDYLRQLQHAEEVIQDEVLNGVRVSVGVTVGLGTR